MIHSEPTIAPSRSCSRKPAELVKTIRPGGTGLVKSAARVLEILQYFDGVRRPATEREIFLALELPQSSSSALLHTMADLGYLNYDYATRCYGISERVSLLGNWLDSDLVIPGRVVSLMAEIGRTTQQTVGLARHHGAYIQYIHVLDSPSRRDALLQSGVVRPICGTVPGIAFLANAGDAEITSMVHRSNADAVCPEHHVSPGRFRELLCESRHTGFAYGQSVFCDGLHVLSATLPPLETGSRLAISIVSRDEGFADKQHAFGSGMISAIKRAFEPTHQ
jgi:DNA-binding IclR family transcriptional regulator